MTFTLKLAWTAAEAPAAPRQREGALRPDRATDAASPHRQLRAEGPRLADVDFQRLRLSDGNARSESQIVERTEHE